MTDVYEDKASAYDYNKTIHDGKNFSRKKVKHKKDKAPKNRRHICGCDYCIDGKLHKHNRNMDVMSVDDGVELMYDASEDAIDFEFNGPENR